MKIQGPRLQKINTYQEQLKNNQHQKQKRVKEDQLDISSEAKKLQEKGNKIETRAEYIQDIKKAIQSGTYDVKYEEVAKKMIDYWFRN